MRRVSAVIFVAFGLLPATGRAESLREKANTIRQAMDARDFDRAESLVRDLKSSDPSGFRANNCDYLLGRLAERRGLATEATALYLGRIAGNHAEIEGGGFGC